MSATEYEYDCRYFLRISHLLQIMFHRTSFFSELGKLLPIIKTHRRANFEVLNICERVVFKCYSRAYKTYYRIFKNN